MNNLKKKNSVNKEPEIIDPKYIKIISGALYKGKKTLTLHRCKSGRYFYHRRMKKEEIFQILSLATVAEENGETFMDRDGKQYYVGRKFIKALYVDGIFYLILNNREINEPLPPEGYIDNTDYSFALL